MVALLSILGVIGGGMTVSQMVPPVSRELAYRTNALIPNQEQQIIDLIALTWRGVIDKEETQERLLRHGIDTHKAQELFFLTKRQFEVDELVVLYRKGVIEKGKFDRLMMGLGYESPESDLILNTREYLPSASDLVRFAVREVYSQDIIDRFKLDEDFPERFAEEAQKVGMTNEQALNFWRAHWELPSLSMGLEMLHRKVITDDELDLLMRTLDINPFWREKLKQISYTPLTRVDVRRMYELGVLDKDQVEKSYTDIGYNEENAKLMTEFTIVNALPAERDLTRTMIEKAWEQGELNYPETVNLLMNLGYDQLESELILGLKENAIEEKELEDKIEVIENLLMSGVFTFEEAIEGLNTLNLKDSYAQKVYARLVRQKDKAQEFPSKTDLEKMLKANVIDTEKFIEYMQRIGYSRDLIDLYYELYTGEELED